MHATLETLLSYLHAADSHEAIRTAVEKVRDHYRVLHAAYRWVTSEGERFGAGTCPAAWADRYVERDYLRMDPVVLGCFQRFTPADWKELDWSSKPARAMLRDALDHGLGNQGYTVPVRGPGGQFALFTLNTNADDDAWAAFIAANRRDLVILAHEFNRKALELELGEAGQTPPSLSPREISVIHCLARGLSRAQAAAELNISEHTLRVYIESARHKLGALNTTHAVARALTSGILIV